MVHRRLRHARQGALPAPRLEVAGHPTSGGRFVEIGQGTVVVTVCEPTVTALVGELSEPASPSASARRGSEPGGGDEECSRNRQVGMRVGSTTSAQLLSPSSKVRQKCDLIIWDHSPESG